jgi:cytosine deaminase
MLDLIIKNARLRFDNRTHRINIEEGKISSIDGGEVSAKKKIDARGLLVTESYVIAHLHLDKVYTYSVADKNTAEKYHKGNSIDAIREASRIKESLNEQVIYRNAKRAINNALKYGVCAIRGFADVDDILELKGIRALLKLKEEFSGMIDLQVVAFPQEGILSQKSTEELLEKAIELGADVVGGIPWIEKNNESKEKHVRKVLQIAVKHNKDVAMLVDDCCTSSSRTLEILARETIRNKWKGRVQACHARAMQFYDEEYLERVCELCELAGMSLVINPHTGPCNPPVERLLDKGITLALGQDDCSDAYYPFGRCKMTEVAFIASHVLRMMLPSHFESLYDMITCNPARIMRIDNFGIEEGRYARLVILPVRTVYEAIWYQAEPLILVNGNKLFKLKSRS